MTPTLLKHISAYLTKWTPVFVTAVAVFTYFFPNTFAWVKGNTQTSILGFIMLTMGLTLSKEDFRILISRPIDMLIGVTAQYLLMPIIAWTVAKALNLPHPVAVGLLLVGCCPGGVSSNIMSFLCKGDVAFSVGMTTVTTLLAPIMTPVLMLHLAGENVDVDAIGMFKSILIVTILPVALGFALNAAFSDKSRFAEIKKTLPGCAVIGLACIVGGVVSAHGQKIVASGIVIFAAVLLHNTLGYILGYITGLLAKFSNSKCRTISIEVGMQNAGLATVLSAKHFPAMPEAAIASAVSCVWHSISGALLAGIFNVLDNIKKRRAR
ncbi:MAG: bile acid:sodium symporter family protein [Kiritimatiellae bacterium]|nr:bile acid:sodium symporter family protein [Kiritimatiellia bacterium]